MPTTARDAAATAFPSFDVSQSLRRAPYASPTQVKVEKKDEGIEAMRKLMGGAADEDDEEGG